MWAVSLTWHENVKSLDKSVLSAIQYFHFFHTVFTNIHHILSKAYQSIKNHCLFFGKYHILSLDILQKAPSFALYKIVQCQCNWLRYAYKHVNIVLIFHTFSAMVWTMKLTQQCRKLEKQTARILKLFKKKKNEKQLPMKLCKIANGILYKKALRYDSWLCVMMHTRSPSQY